MIIQGRVKNSPFYRQDNDGSTGAWFLVEEEMGGRVDSYSVSASASALDGLPALKQGVPIRIMGSAYAAPSKKLRSNGQPFLNVNIVAMRVEILHYDEVQAQPVEPEQSEPDVPREWGNEEPTIDSTPF